MKTIIPLFFFLAFRSWGADVSPIGQWRTIDDNDKKERAIIEIFEKEKRLFGKIVKTFPRSDDKEFCEACPGDLKGAKILGLEILKGVSREEDSKTWSGGTILDPKNGTSYKVYIELLDDGDKKNAKLKVRGYVGFALLGRTQYWYRYEEPKTEESQKPEATIEEPKKEPPKK